MPVVRLLLVLVSLLAVACGPSEETVACCECLAANEAEPVLGGTCVLDGAAGIEDEEEAFGVCVSRIESEPRPGVLTSTRCLVALEGHDQPACATACEPMMGHLRP